MKSGMQGGAFESWKYGLSKKMKKAILNQLKIPGFLSIDYVRGLGGSIDISRADFYGVVMATYSLKQQEGCKIEKAHVLLYTVYDLESVFDLYPEDCKVITESYIQRHNCNSMPFYSSYGGALQNFHMLDKCETEQQKRLDKIRKNEERTALRQKKRFDEKVLVLSTALKPIQKALEGIAHSLNIPTPQVKLSKDDGKLIIN